MPLKNLIFYFNVVPVIIGRKLFIIKSTIPRKRLVFCLIQQFTISVKNMHYRRVVLFYSVSFESVVKPIVIGSEKVWIDKVNVFCCSESTAIGCLYINGIRAAFDINHITG